MEAAAHRKENAPEHVVGIVIHITDALHEQQRNNMVSTLENDDRVVVWISAQSAAIFCSSVMTGIIIFQQMCLVASQPKMSVQS